MKHWDLLVVQNDILYKKFFRNEAEYLTFIAPQQVRFEVFQMLHSQHTAGHLVANAGLTRYVNCFIGPT